ncbi:b family protein : ATPases with chaperone activity ClpC, two ATP-binding domain OS=Microscilla marina ATCC 23134 GN=M23134_04999 PE=4 SV=1: AAA_2: ClpB_D2-small [Gemmataceae bacterium]|nr:b family protein : ATPases with chaperone activity ClpC, two ATP-binding domain OS=Microscilla marina ATCC 23134 GN=M23134_04999 PE=4 SV=1: AAA_2: ClpB_D2-small [Gemmataceae bacterium]VTT96724.1 b family protein : ATPases with chaperone activity ClpC, two ATP-binding domain OS=Microscilla marina ATCC 23134 GN=M23134_04999 PE=4 SV=1: AAA_2: ClpB_D2-small [Gemmataceae bacterium]
MNFRIPVYVYQHPQGYAARPLFATDIEERDTNLNRLLTKLTRRLVTTIEQAARKDRHDPVAEWAFSPRVTTHRVALDVELRRRVARVKYLLVAFDHMGRRLAFTPALPDVWFEVTRGEPLEARAQAVFTEHWRNAEREADDEEEVRPEATNLAGKAWVQVLELSASVPAVAPKPPAAKFLFLGGADTGDGAAELRRVGRCLDWLYPDELERAVLRDREVGELSRLLELGDRRPVLLCGPRLAGKTAVVHEAVFHRVAQRKRVHVQEGNVWLVSPQRLVSGMSYVGQWEGRLLAILKHAKKRDHVLYFDDLIGLFLAGVSANSTLNAATVLKPYLERRDVRVLGEVSTDGLRVLQERDRGFADLFHLIPVREPTDADNLRILVDQQRRLEGKHGCDFGLDVLPTVIDVQRRYDRTAAFPGKAAAILTRLAIRATADPSPAVATGVRRSDFNPLAGRPQITRDDVLADFAARSGLSLAFLDPKQRLDRDDVRDAVREQVVGQAEAVEALADVVSVAKARLNDPDRPLAAFLFLGPTGVGKTECAKAIARTLFGDAERLLRFDLNEFNQYGAAARLVGTFQQPEGLLTSAIRRQPFAVVLLDEIEKAHPEVFDLLLSVLGEGRLTDALGRTADFSNAIIIMTSNLGVREAQGGLGFNPEADRSFAYTGAAEKFFRPEFFNRLDRVIPFKKLTRVELAAIARKLVNDVLAREGFGQRKCVLNVSADALERVIDAGYDPALGARAMKRAVERELAQPAAARLAELLPGEFTIVTVQARDNTLSVSVQAPGWAEKVPLEDRAALPVADRLAAAWAALEQIDGVLDVLRPAGAVVAGKVSPEHERYFALKEGADAIGETLNAFEDRLAEVKLSRVEARQPEGVGRKGRYRSMKIKECTSARWNEIGEQPLRSLLSATSMEEALRELFDAAEPLPDDADLFEAENRLALLRLMATAPVDDRPVYLWIRGFPEGQVSDVTEALWMHYLGAWTTGLGVEVENEWFDRTAGVISVKGVHARALALTECGTHLFLPKHGGPVPVRVDVVDSLPPRVADLFAFGPIVRVYPEGQPVADVRTGLVSPLPGKPDFAETFRTFTLAALPRAT